jgi:hypothetical protein
MQILAQGLVGITDIFIHPNYISSTSPMENPLIIGMLAIIIGLTYVIFFYILTRMEKHVTKKKDRERAMDKWLEPIPPPRNRR